MELKEFKKYIVKFKRGEERYRICEYGTDPDSILARFDLHHRPDVFITSIKEVPDWEDKNER